MFCAQRATPYNLLEGVMDRSVKIQKISKNVIYKYIFLCSVLKGRHFIIS